MKVRKRRPDERSSQESVRNDDIKDNNKQETLEPLSHNPLPNSVFCLMCGVLVGVLITTIYNNITQRNLNHIHQTSHQRETASTANNGGWRLADEDTIKFLDTKICNIDKKYYNEVTVDQFESVYRYKKPVIIKFPDGAAGWTDPDKYTVPSLQKAYGDWEVLSGRSDDIVRRGGRGDTANSFQDYVDLIMNDKVDNREPM